MTEPVTWPEEKRCTHCKRTKPAAEFYKQTGSKDGLQSWCKTCSSAQSKDWAASTTGRARQRAYRLRYRFGLTVEQYDAMLTAQEGRCAICRAKPRKNRHLSVDHDHSCCPGPISCGRCIRGLLCDMCNQKALGYWLKEGTKGTERALATARRLVAYLERSQDGRVARAA